MRRRTKEDVGKGTGGRRRRRKRRKMEDADTMKNEKSAD